MIGSFIPNYQMEQKTKKPRVHSAPAVAPISIAATEEESPSAQEPKGQSSGNPASSVTPPVASFFRAENWASPPMNTPPESRDSPADVNGPLPGG